MPEKILDAAELRFIKAAASGCVHIWVHHPRWVPDSFEDVPVTGDGTAFAKLLGQPTITRCGLRTWPDIFADSHHQWTETFPDEALCAGCYRTLHPDDQARAFEHNRPDNDLDDTEKGPNIMADAELPAADDAVGQEFASWRNQPDAVAAIAKIQDLNAALDPGGAVAEAELALRSLYPVTIAHGSCESQDERDLLYTDVDAWARQVGDLTSTRSSSEHTTYLFTTAEAAAAFHARLDTADLPFWWRITTTATPNFR